MVKEGAWGAVDEEDDGGGGDDDKDGGGGKKRSEGPVATYLKTLQHILKHCNNNNNKQQQTTTNNPPEAACSKSRKVSRRAGAKTPLLDHKCNTFRILLCV